MTVPSSPFCEDDDVHDPDDPGVVEAHELVAPSPVKFCCPGRELDDRDSTSTAPPLVRAERLPGGADREVGLAVAVQVAGRDRPTEVVADLGGARYAGVVLVPLLRTGR